MDRESMVPNIVTVVLNRLNSFVLEDINPALGVKEELEKLQKTIILMIEAVIRDADNKQVKEEAERIWLKELEDLAYDADDILDKYEYDIMRRLNPKRDKVRNFFSSSFNPFVLPSLRICHQIKNLNKKFDEIASRRRVWLSSQIIIHLGSSSSHTKDDDDRNRIYRDTCSLVHDSEIVGREVDKSKIINMLLAENLCNQFEEIIPVIPIVGMGGLGKTTLAQIVYNENDVDKHFDKKMWVYVSSECNSGRLFRKILESSTNKKCEALDMNVIVHQLQQQLSGKAYLLVLDDVWNMNADQWNRLRLPLLYGSNGSRIIITTRSEEVASIVVFHKNISIYKLETLGEDECWSIFKQNAFRSIEQTPTLMTIGKKLVNKCGGLPLAVKALGSVMQSKKEEHEWLTFKDNEIWDASEVLQVLKLSYDHLPSHLRRCFSYCSIFPKDSEIERETLIRLWIAEGFIQPPKGAMISIEEIGNGYFSSLLLNSFFQEVKRDDKLGDITVYKMPNLLHDLAQFVAGTHECSIVEASQVKDISELRRLRLLNFDEESSAIIEKALKNAKKLRTIFANQGRVKNIENVFTNNKLLRVLDLSRTQIIELPSSIGGLTHLRYLDLSFTEITKLPNSITRLYNLQTLNLTGCRNLNKLPKDFLYKLTNLINFQFNRHKIESPIEIPQLATLPSNTIEGISESEGLTSGEGQVENLKDGKKADKENLKQTQNIKQVALTWNDETMLNEDHDSNTDSLVLEGLRPHPSLRSLVITCFMVPTFPKWMGDPLFLPNLVELEFHSCNRCEQLPALGKLPFLRLLIVRGMIAIKRLGREFYYGGGEGSILLSEEAATNATIAFPSLNELVLDDMPNLEEWVEPLQPKVSYISTSASSSTSTSSFPLLESIEIKLCPKLKSIPTLFPSLENLEYYSSNGTSLSCVVRSNLDSLVSLYIEEVPRLVFLPQGLLTNDNVLQCLDIYECPDFQGFIYQGEEIELFNSNRSSLQFLTILDCPVLTFLPGIRGMTSLQRLTILDCNKELNILPDDLECLSSLEEFEFGSSHPNEIEEAEE